MAGSTENWKTQIRKGYLELCILLLIKRHKKLYGFDLLERLLEREQPRQVIVFCRTKRGTDKIYERLSRRRGRAGVGVAGIFRVANGLETVYKDTATFSSDKKVEFINDQAETLRAIVNRASDRQTRQRYHLARSFWRALDGWRQAAAYDSGGPIVLLLDKLQLVVKLTSLTMMVQQVKLHQQWVVELLAI